MSNTFPPKFAFFLFIALFSVVLVGCSHSKTSRGHLFRGDWAFEYNRTPWIGLPPDSGCPEDEEGFGLFDCLKKDRSEKQQGFRRHCAMRADCTAENPCCRTLGCGMWVNPADPATLANLGGTAKACGLTPFCSPQKPCRLTPNCGKPVNVNLNPQILMAGNQSANPNLPLGLGGMTGRNFGTNNNVMMPNGMETVRGMSPNGSANAAQGLSGTLVSRGVVPGASVITSGGIVAAIGVATPAGTMTPIGVRQSNGMVNNNIVLRACTMSPNCTAAHPCGLTPNCGGMVAINMVSNNAAALASALQAQGVASGVMQTGGMGTLVNPMTNQPISGITMSGYAQAGYPPIGYAPTGYAPGYPRYAPGMVDTGTQPTEEEQMEEMPEEEIQSVLPETRSAMPVPRFHPIPSKPAFQRSEGMTPTPKAQRSIAKPTTTAMAESGDSEEAISDQEMEAALDQAYLEGVSAAMDEVERKMEAKRQAVAKVKLEEKILQQAENVQKQIEEQEKLQQLVMQNERKLRQQQAARMQPESLIAEVIEPQRLSQLQQTAKQTAAAPRPEQRSVQQPTVAAANVQRNQPQPNPMVAVKNNDANILPVQLPVQIVEDLKTSVVSRVNDVFTPLLGLNKRVQRSVQPQSRQSIVKAEEMAITPPNLPGRPAVLPMTSKFGLLPDEESDSSIQQAQFTDNN